MTPKFTPGPWNRVKPWLSEYWTLGVIRNHAAIPLESEDDWTLAEAAPEMYEALKDLVQHASLLEIMSAYSVERARAALAKAEGKP